jgi:hypothetical protein
VKIRIIRVFAGVCLAALAACQATSPGQPEVTLEEAKRITASFERPAYTPPQRSIDDVLALIDDPAISSILIPPECDDCTKEREAEFLGSSRSHVEHFATVPLADGNNFGRQDLSLPRSLLVTHWPVETTSAKALTTEVFRRQSASPSLSRAQALRQAMVSLIDGPGYVDATTGQSVFSYAHPIFWAPFALVGDGSN